MVVLVVDDYEQVSMLEDALIKANIFYEVEIGNECHGLRQPYLIVDGVPLDMGRALKWIGGKKNE